MGTRPATQTCSVNNGSGTMGGSNVTNVGVSCVSNNTTLTVPATGTIPATAGGTITNTVTVTNTGSVTATNVHAVLPGGWTAVTQTPCATIAPNNGTCNLVFSSTKPYVAQGGITITGDNITSPPTMALAFTIQGYLVFSVESATNANVIDNSDLVQTPWGGGENVITNAQSLTDGFTNTATIQATPGIGASAAVNCYNSTAGGVSAGTWYLPAICQMGSVGEGAGCSPGIANININLVQLGFGGLSDSVVYWSSTEYSGQPMLYAWSQGFFSSGAIQYSQGKVYAISVRCSRALTI